MYLLLLKVGRLGIDGKMYRAIKAINERPQSGVLVSDRMPDWFPEESSVRQGNSLSRLYLLPSLSMTWQRFCKAVEKV